MKSSRKSRLVAGAVTLLVLGVVGFVYAAWTTNGSGSGYAQAGTAQALSTVDVSASTTADLYPGTNGTLVIKVHNPNPYQVTVTDIVGTGPGTVVAAGTGTCTTTGVTLNDQHGLSLVVPANADSTLQTIANGARMSNASDNGCQSAKFAIPVSLSGASS